jgi:hypothetical protein
MDERHIDAQLRMDRHLRLLPPDARCGMCGIDIGLVLVRRFTGIVCYRCRNVLRGHSPFERHHVGGKGTWCFAIVPANLHRILSWWQDLTWRGVEEPGSERAIAIDLMGLTILGFLYAERT